MADHTDEKAQIVEVLSKHIDVNSDHVMHGWACSCGWGGVSGPPPWKRHSFDEFLNHVADMLLPPAQTSTQEANRG